MKNPNLLQEMSMEEMRSTEGGFLFLAFIAGIALGALLDVLINHM